MHEPTTHCRFCGKPLEEHRTARAQFCNSVCRAKGFRRYKAQCSALVEQLAASSPGQRPGLVEKAKALAEEYK